MNRIIQGVAHGTIIELSENLGLADGQAVEVVVQPIGPSRPVGEGIRKSAGGLADQWSKDDDKILED
ncbi:MAG: hypothetical protein ABR915_06200, partial [Thermoguttaceae bacterium]